VWAPPMHRCTSLRQTYPGVSEKDEFYESPVTHPLPRTLYHAPSTTHLYHAPLPRTSTTHLYPHLYHRPLHPTQLYHPTPYHPPHITHLTSFIPHHAHPITHTRSRTPNHTHPITHTLSHITHSHPPPSPYPPSSPPHLPQTRINHPLSPTLHPQPSCHRCQPGHLLQMLRYRDGGSDAPHADRSAQHVRAALGDSETVAIAHACCERRPQSRASQTASCAK